MKRRRKPGCQAAFRDIKTGMYGFPYQGTPKPDNGCRAVDDDSRPRIALGKQQKEYPFFRNNSKVLPNKSRLIFTNSFEGLLETLSKPRAFLSPIFAYFSAVSLC